MNAKAANDPERRTYPRIKTKLPVELRCAGKAQMRTATDEVSLCGCYIETMFTIEIGTSTIQSWGLQAAALLPCRSEPALTASGPVFFRWN